ncbi:DUF1850 domain-containing protein [Limnobacter sp.]|uniref:DUF1850 domain-containing protein n=1 Tax=Limnobacter sp. TaxID=2003368 RepID=UPI003514AB2B
MASVCVFSSAALLLGCLNTTTFSLQWTHSVEKTTWVEHYQITHTLELQATLVKVKGSGAGIDPAPHAKRVDGWYQWKPQSTLRLQSIALANSQATPDNWTLCALPAGQACIRLNDFADKAPGGFVIRAQ